MITLFSIIIVACLIGLYLYYDKNLIKLIKGVGIILIGLIGMAIALILCGLIILYLP